MAGRSRLCSGPEEILSHIVEHLRTPDHLMHPPWPWPDDQPIRLTSLKLTDANPTAYESPRASRFDLFRRIMERKPHLAGLVRGIEVFYGYSDGLDTSHVFDSLLFLPKIKRMDFPLTVKLDLNLLSVINSHPSLLTVHWQTTNAFSFPNPLSLPHDALSRVLINEEELSGDFNSIELLYFTELGLRVRGLTIRGTTPPPFLSLTYPDLREICIDVGPVFSSDSPEPLRWFPSFLERHPQLQRFSIGLGTCERRQSWEALKDVPIMRPLYDASHSRGLISSFSISNIGIEIERFSSSWAVINVDSPQVFPKIIHLLGSLLSPIQMITLHFRKPEPHILPINVNDFVPAFQENYKTLSSLSLCDVCQVLDLDSFSTDEELHVNDTDIDEGVLSDSHLRDRTKQLAQLTLLLCAGLPRLHDVDFHEDDFDVSMMTPA